MARFCASCGTEVDDTAVFCPTCGQPIDDGAEPDLPAAPAWPDPAASDAAPPPAGAASGDGYADAERERVPDGRSAPPAAPEAPTRVEERPAPAQPATAAAAREPGLESDGRSSDGRPSDGRAGGRGLPSIDLPLTMPVTLSGWLIGIGSVLAVVGLLVVLVTGVLNVIDLVLFLALLAIAATVFLAAHLPAIPHLRLATLVVALIAFGVALDRVGFRGGGVGELLLFLGTAAAGIGAILLELGQDQPLGRPQR